MARETMYELLACWINDVMVRIDVNAIRALCFNLYENESIYSLELVGTPSYDKYDAEWACDEISDYGTRETPFCWKSKRDWKVNLNMIEKLVKQYIHEGSFIEDFKSLEAVAVGFVEGDLVIVYEKKKGCI